VKPEFSTGWRHPDRQIGFKQRKRTLQNSGGIGLPDTHGSVHIQNDPNLLYDICYMLNLAYRGDNGSRKGRDKVNLRKASAAKESRGSLS
jgi:hypothetical protein